MQAWTGLLDLIILLGAACALGILAEQLRQSALVGYILAGMLVGPNVLGWVQSSNEVDMLAEIGAALLLCTIGLEFSFQRLKQLGRRTFFAGFLQIVVTASIAALAAAAFKLPPRTALVIGAIIALSSTACVVRILWDHALTDSRLGRSAIGVLLLQDVAVVPLVILVTALCTDTGLDSSFWNLTKTIGWGALMIAVFYLLLNYVFPPLIHLRGLARNRELPILLASLIAVGSTWTSHYIGLSPAFGAFLAGLLIAESPFARQIRADIASLRTLLITLFFAAIGMYGDPLWAVNHIIPVIGLTAAIIFGKTLILALIMVLLRFPFGHGLAAGLALAQIGEFSFVLAGIALNGNVLTPDAFRLIISATLISLILTPYLVKWAPHLAQWRFKKTSPASAPSDKPDEIQLISEQTVKIPTCIKNPILIIGFGPAGRCVAEALLDQYRQDLVAIDVNPRHYKIAQNYNIAFSLGDATHPDLLEHLNLHQARAVVVTVPDHFTARHIIQLCRSLAPRTHIIARCRHHIYLGALHLAGADKVIDEETEMGLELARYTKEFLPVQHPDATGPADD